MTGTGPGLISQNHIAPAYRTAAIATVIAIAVAPAAAAKGNYTCIDCGHELLTTKGGQ
jgi:hypothetical protein